MDRRLRTAAFGTGIAVLLLATAVIVFNVESFSGDGEGRSLIGFDFGAAAEHVEALVQWGPRNTGSEAELNGALYIERQFMEAGLTDVHIENFTATLFEVRSTDLCLVPYMPRVNVPRPGGAHIEFTHIIDYVVQGNSGSLAWSNFRDDLMFVDIGNGSDPASFSQARGMVCFIEQDENTPSNWDLYQMAVDAGVRAVILQNTFQGDKLGYLPFFKSGPDLGSTRIPVLMVGREAGDTILSHTDHRIRLDLDVVVEERPVRVVVGDIKGSADDIVVFGAHHDTCYNTIGVVDNTQGAATIIELARAMVSSGRHFSATMRFATFGGEEEGLFGSEEYYKAHAKEMESCRAYFNFDMAHMDKRTMEGVLTCTDNSTLRGIDRYIDLLIEEEPSMSVYKLSTAYSQMSHASSDYHAFVAGGAIGVAGWGSGCEEYHTYQDDMSHLNPESLQIWSRITGSYACDRWG
jgi:hypothetical protein